MGAHYSPISSPKSPYTPRTRATSACWLALISLALSIFALLSTFHASAWLNTERLRTGDSINRVNLRSFLLKPDEDQLLSNNKPLLVSGDDWSDSHPMHDKEMLNDVRADESQSNQAELALRSGTHPSSEDSRISQGSNSTQTANDTLLKGSNEGKEKIALEDVGGSAASIAVSETKHDASKDENGFTSMLAQCRTLECLRIAHELPRREDQFNFPHALIVGWQKSATTSLYKFLGKSDQVLLSQQKEPEFFTAKCRAKPLNGCSEKDQANYIEETLQRDLVTQADATVMTFEASTHYAMNGDVLASGILQAMPWVRVIASLREPISRAASMLVHMADREKAGCLTKQHMTLYQCLITESQLLGHSGPFNYIDSPYGNYSYALQSWVSTFPLDQVFVVQYEALTGAEETSRYELQRLQKFLGLDPKKMHADGSLSAHNVRKNRINPDGWTMMRSEYVDLIHRVRPDAESVAKLVEDIGQGNAQAWMQAWERIWEDNLESCDPDGLCKIHLS